MFAQWQEWWSALKTHGISRLFYPEVREKAATIKLSIKELKTLVQIVTGHGLYKRHLRHWNEILDCNCSLCGEALEDSWHLWMNCPSLRRERNEIEGLNLTMERAVIKFFNLPKLRALAARNECILDPRS